MTKIITDGDINTKDTTDEERIRPETSLATELANTPDGSGGAISLTTNCSGGRASSFHLTDARCGENPSSLALPECKSSNDSAVAHSLRAGSGLSGLEASKTGDSERVRLKLDGASDLPHAGNMLACFPDSGTRPWNDKKQRALFSAQASASTAPVSSRGKSCATALTVVVWAAGARIKRETCTAGMDMSIA